MGPSALAEDRVRYCHEWLDSVHKAQRTQSSSTTITAPLTYKCSYWLLQQGLNTMAASDPSKKAKDRCVKMLKDLAPKYSIVLGAGVAGAALAMDCLLQQRSDVDLLVQKIKGVVLANEATKMRGAYMSCMEKYQDMLVERYEKEKIRLAQDIDDGLLKLVNLAVAHLEHSSEWGDDEGQVYQLWLLAAFQLLLVLRARVEQKQISANRIKNVTDRRKTEMGRLMPQYLKFREASVRFDQHAVGDLEGNLVFEDTFTRTKVEYNPDFKGLECSSFCKQFKALYLQKIRDEQDVFRESFLA